VISFLHYTISKGNDKVDAIVMQIFCKRDGVCGNVRLAVVDFPPVVC